MRAPPRREAAYRCIQSMALMRRAAQLEKLIQPVGFDQGVAGGVVLTTKERGVISGHQRDNKGRFTNFSNRRLIYKIEFFGPPNVSPPQSAVKIKFSTPAFPPIFAPSPHTA